MDRRSCTLQADALRKTSLDAILLFAILDIVMAAVINLIVFRTGMLNFIAYATRFLISPTLVVNLAMLAILVFGIMMRFGRLRLADLGIKKGRVMAGFLASISLWVMLQVITLVMGFAATGKIHWNLKVPGIGFTFMMGAFVDQLFGNCLFEEIAFRGFLVPQIHKRLKSGKRRMVTAILISQLFFSLMHIPNRIYSGSTLPETLVSLAVVLALGILFACVYVYTDNLFFAIGVHTLVNIPLNVVETSAALWFVVALSILMTILWPVTFGKFQRPTEQANAEDTLQPKLPLGLPEA